MNGDGVGDQKTAERVIAEHADFLAAGSGIRHCTCGRWDSGEIAPGSRVSFAAHVVEALRDNGIEMMRLPEPNRFVNDEKEWEFSGQHSDGFVNLTDVIEISIAEDDGQSDSMPTIAEGRIPHELATQCALALLAASRVREVSDAG